MKSFRIAAWILCLLLPLWAQADGIQATLNRNQVQLGDTVTLNVHIDGGGDLGSPDLSALAGDFDILGSSTDSSLSIVNGRQSSLLTLGIVLRPKRVGTLTIPSLTIAGSHTQPLRLEVTPPTASASAHGDKSVFLEAVATPDHSYVGQQLIYTVKLYISANLSNGSLDDPQLPGADIRRLGGDIDYDTERGGRTYHVIERRYALTPQRAGTLVMPALHFQGEMLAPVDPNDPTANFFGQAGLFGNTTPVSADAPQVSIPVSPVPADWGTMAWLPARQLTLTLDGLPADGQLHVGQPLNLHMRVQADGLSAESLPEPSLPALDDAQVYPDQTVDSTKSDGQWLTGQRERGFAIVPGHAGTLVIPATTVKWFDVLSGKTEIASIPEHRLTVLPAAGDATAPSAPPPSATDVSSMSGHAAPALPTAATVSDADAMPWRWIALGSLGLWLLSLLGWWLWRRRRVAPAAPPTPTPAPVGASTRSLREAFLAGAHRGEAAAQARSLLAWARSERPLLQNLGELSAALASEAQRTAIAALQRRQYAGVAGDAGVDLHAAFVRGFEWRAESGSQDASPLPPLYPFKLH